MKTSTIVKASLLAALLTVGSAPAWAVFTPTKVQNVTALVTTGGTKNATYTLAVKNISNLATTTNITWSGVDPAVTSWKVADQFVQLNWSVTDQSGGIQIYTDNTNISASPRFVDPTISISSNSDSNPAGLLQVPVTGSTTSVTLPVAWSIKADTVTIVAADPNDNIAHGKPSDNAASFQWLFLLDKVTPAIDRNGDGILGNAGDSAAFPFPTGPFVQAIKGPGAVSGIHFGQADNEFAADQDKISYVYMQAEFSTAAALTAYQTNRLVFEAFIQ